MATIDNEGIVEIKEKVGSALTSIYDKLEASNNFGEVTDEFDFLFKFLEEIETWDRPNIMGSKPKSVVIDGQLYTPQLGG